MGPAEGRANPIAARPNEVQLDVAPLRLRPTRRDLIGRRLEAQRALVLANHVRATPILVTIEGVICDGPHAVRAFAEDPARCVVEADQIHNPPELIRNFSSSKLGYDWTVERASFLDQTSAADRAVFEGPWAELRRHAESPELADAS